MFECPFSFTFTRKYNTRVTRSCFKQQRKRLKRKDQVYFSFLLHLQRKGLTKNGKNERKGCNLSTSTSTSTSTHSFVT